MPGGDIGIVFDASLQGTALADLESIKSQLDSLVKGTYKIPVDLDDSALQSKIKSLKSDLTGLSGGSLSAGKSIAKNANTGNLTKNLKQQTAELKTQKQVLDSLTASAKKMHQSLTDKPLKNATKQAEAMQDLRVLMDNINRASNVTEEGRSIGKNLAVLENSAQALSARVSALRADESAAEKAAEAEKKLSDAIKSDNKKDTKALWSKEIGQMNKDLTSLETAFRKLDTSKLNKGASEALGKDITAIRGMADELKTVTSPDMKNVKDVFATQSWIREASTQLEQLSAKAKQAAAAEKEVNKAWSDAEKSRQSDINKQLQTLQARTDSFNKKYDKLNLTGIEGDASIEAYAKQLERVQQLGEKAKKVTPFDGAEGQAAIDAYSKAVDELGNRYTAVSDKVKQFAQEEKAAAKEAAAMQRQATSMQGQIQKLFEKNKRLDGTFYGTQLNDIRDEIQGKIDAGVKFSPGDIARYRAEIDGITESARAAGKIGATLGDTIVGAFKKFGGWMLVTHSLTSVTNGIRQMINNVRELDAAMTELKKVTDLSDAAYEQVFENASERAKRTGATLTDTINATADLLIVPLCSNA